ncbi:M3 family oligoendopeptidase [Stomatobaculum sp. F0698]|uniref:M3 family oligoendopeptidase n=1 Tax=Stomatobaculum sp. F0698 TaxID=3059030 RepID=UPI00272D3820|nr:M3 family oligoendopeptidase [Stomatobaculum sp. F0698]WLD86351.1 M3 family oligoendopeptidase [Stomatobaculum sp. F0698]
MKFKEMQYERISVESIAEEEKKLIKALKEAKSFAEAEAAFLEEDKLSGHISTMSALASIRHSIDTTDKFYDDEQNYWNNAFPQIQAYSQEWTQALLASPFRKEFEEKYGSIIFVNAEMELKTFSPEIIPLLQQENELVTAYEKLLASAEIPFEGEYYTISQMSLFKNDPDDARRLAAWKAEGQWYKDNQEELDRIYDQLVKLRDEMGKKLGYENFLPLGYYRMQRNSYDKNDVEKFRAAVQKYVVPVAVKVYERQAKRLGKTYPMSYADNAMEFRSGNPKPQGTPDDIVAVAKKFYEWRSPETAEFFNHMIEDELMDLLSTKGKQGGGYCAGLRDYKTPFIFANFNGTQHDVEVVTHEAGHAFADYTNRNRVPIGTCGPSLEACEVHSMSMEYFAEAFADQFFGPDGNKFKYSHLSGSLCFIPYGTMVDHFQHIVYENPQLTPAERHAKWKELLAIYQPWMKLDGEIPFYAEGQSWQRQHHIYSMPFYYIDYCLAQTVALQFWNRIQKDQNDAWKHYMAYTVQGGSVVFTELLKNAGLDSPFEGDCLKEVCETAAKYLDNFDLTGIE